MATVVQCRNVDRDFGRFRALDDVSFEVQRGEIFGIIGPNGAGKTTLLNCLEGLDRPSSGGIEVLNLDPVRDKDALAQRVGVQLQNAALPPRLTVRDALEMYSALYGRTRPWRDLLRELGIEDKAKTRIEKLSGGERQRTFVALALLNQPELAFLDELTTALDPQSRRNMWEIIEQVRDGGTTVVLTTHYMEEAERLCDRVAIVDAGRVVAIDTVPALIREHGGGTSASITLHSAPSETLDLSDILGLTHCQIKGSELSFHGSPESLQSVLMKLSENNLTIASLDTTSPGLEDVFLALTGRNIEAEEKTA